MKHFLVVVAAVGSLTAQPPVGAMRGDADENGEVNVNDCIHVLDWFFLRGPEACASGGSVSCADVNGDDAIDVTDAVYLIRRLFLGGPALVCPQTHQKIEEFTYVGLNAHGYPEYTHDQTGMVFVLLPGGEVHHGRPGR